MFQLPPGAPATLYTFTGGGDGATPYGTLALAPDGSFYGTTFQGGNDDNGTIFPMGSNGALTNLMSFFMTNGDLPTAGLTPGTDGFFYGTASQGGDSGFGTAFRMTTNGTVTTLNSFAGTNDGGLLGR